MAEQNGRRIGRNPFLLDTPPLSFRGRSPFELRQTPGLPPPAADPLRIDYEGGQPIINGVPLPVVRSLPQDSAGIVRTIEVENPSGVFLPQNYGDAITIPIVFAALGERAVLPRPNTWRTSLLIQNLTVVGNVFYCFDRIADNISCVAIGAGGNRLFDYSVPQGDLHLFSTGAGTVIVEYVNRDITATAYR